MPRPLARPVLPIVLSIAALAIAGCRSIGPGTIPRDRFDYNRAIAESWKHQALLNIVKIRYLDVPFWLDVGQVVSGYTFETSVSAAGQLSSEDAIQGDSASIGASGRFTDRPTITYAPLTGDRFLEAFLAPIPPEKLFGLIQSGYAADFVLELGLESISGLRNHTPRVGSMHSADPEFFRVAELMREVQDAGGVGMRLERVPEGQSWMAVFFREERIPPEIAEKTAEIRRLLGLAADQQNFPLVASPLRVEDTKLAVGTRSVMQLLGALALGVEVPARHRERNLVPPSPPFDAARPPLLLVHSGRDKPSRTFIEVEYEGEWFWIAEDDWRSKRTFTSILFLFSLASAGAGRDLPTITIPAQ